MISLRNSKGLLDLLERVYTYYMPEIGHEALFLKLLRSEVKEEIEALRAQIQEDEEQR